MSISFTNTTLEYLRKARETHRPLDGSNQPIICSSFGCSKQLSLTEQLCGDKCLSCQGKNKLDVTKVMKFK